MYSTTSENLEMLESGVGQNFCSYSGWQGASRNQNLLQAADIIPLRHAATKHLESYGRELEHHSNLERGVEPLSEKKICTM